MVLVLEFNMNHGQAVNQQSHIKAALTVIIILLVGNKLVDDLIR